MNVKVKPFQSGHENIVCDIHNKAFHHWIEKFGFLYGYSDVSKADIAQWAGCGKADVSHIWVAYLNGKVVAYACIQLERGEDGALQLLFVETREGLGQSKIAVLPRYQRRGVASALVNHAMTFYARKGATRALIIAYNDNQPATHLVESLGFKKDAFFAVLWELDLRRPILSIQTCPDVTVRALERSDLVAIASIFKESRPDLRGTFKTIEDVKAFYTRKETWAEVSLVAEYRGEVVGFMEFTKEGLVGIAGVLPRYRKQGIGSTLFHRLLTMMQERGKGKALADSGSVYPDAIRMYERFGFDTSRKQLIWTKML